MTLVDKIANIIASLNEEERKKKANANTIKGATVKNELKLLKREMIPAAKIL